MNEEEFYVAGPFQFVIPYYVTVPLTSSRRTTLEPPRTSPRTVQQVFTERYPYYPCHVFHSLLTTQPCRLTLSRRSRGECDNVHPNSLSPDTLVHPSDTLLFQQHYHELPVLASVRPLRIIDFFNGLIVLDKPQSVPIHPCGKYHKNTVEYFLKRGDYVVADQATAKGATAEFLKAVFRERVRPCHRLDKGTSGILLLASTQAVAGHMNRLFEDKGEDERSPLIQKTYLALVHGRVQKAPLGETFCVDYAIYAVPGRNSEFWCGGQEDDSKKDRKPACTYVKVIWIGTQESMVECKPVTGRTHQIRVHLAFLGHPIVGDDLYGKSTWKATLPKVSGDSAVLLDPLCVECARPWEEAEVRLAMQLSHSCPMLCLHAWRYTIEGITTEAPIPAWVPSGVSINLYESRPFCV